MMGQGLKQLFHAHTVCLCGRTTQGPYLSGQSCGRTHGTDRVTTLYVSFLHIDYHSIPPDLFHLFYCVMFINQLQFIRAVVV